MSDDSLVASLFIGFILWTGLAVFVGVSIGSEVRLHKHRIEAVEAGHAHWTVAPNGSTTFEWNPK